MDNFLWQGVGGRQCCKEIGVLCVDFGWGLLSYQGFRNEGFRTPDRLLPATCLFTWPDFMKGYFAGILVCATIAGVGFLLNAMNPGQDEFETFALAQMKQELCPKVPVFGKDCPKFMDEDKVQVKEIVRQNTRREDFGLFSRYQTQLSLRSIVPPEAVPFLSILPMATSYDLATVGVMGRFYIYQAKEEKL